MSQAIRLLQAFDGDVRIQLCGANRRVAKKFLNASKVGTVIEQMGGRRVSKRVSPPGSGAWVGLQNS